MKIKLLQIWDDFHMKKFILLFTFFLAVLSCTDEDKKEQVIAQIDVNYELERFDLLFDNARPDQLSSLKSDYPFLFSQQVPDSVWTLRMEDSLQQALHSEVKKGFANTAKLEDDIENMFQHLKFYDKSFSEPRVIAITNDVDYRTKVFVTDTIVLIALDNYLGAEHEFYGNIPVYKTKNMEPEQIVPDLAAAYAENYIFQSKNRSLLDEMIYFGKQLYFKDRIIPFVSDANKIGYTEDEMIFAIENENYIWEYLVEKEFLYSTDSSLPARFVADAPFTKFYLELDRESPGRLGQYIGWQIVRAYMSQTETPFLDMLQKDPMEIFNDSKYKTPK